MDAAEELGGGGGGCGDRSGNARRVLHLGLIQDVIVIAQRVAYAGMTSSPAPVSPFPGLVSICASDYRKNILTDEVEYGWVMEEITY
ncbi:hypothetical protein OAN61_00800 [bacterium]|nr:hypothetical protein [bacterium]